MSSEMWYGLTSATSLRVVGTRQFADHHRYTDRDVAGILAAGAGADAIVTTEKDAVKIRKSGIMAIPAEFVFDDDVLQRIAAVARP